LKLEINFTQGTISIWVPDSGRTLAKSVRRVSPLQSGWMK
jgi:hypothetical protein